MVRLTLGSVALLAALFALAGCGGDEPTGAASADKTVDATPTTEESLSETSDPDPPADAGSPVEAMRT